MSRLCLDMPNIGQRVFSRRAKKASMSKFKEAQRQQELKVQEICPTCSKPKSRGTITQWLLGGDDRCQCKTTGERNQPLADEPGIAEIKLANNEDTATVPRPKVELGARYDVLQELGSGASGAVYRVHDKELNKDLAVKLLREDQTSNEGLLARFKQEASLAITLSHENLIGMYGLSETPKGSPFLVMDLLEGRSLDTILKEDGPLSEERFVAIFSQVLEGLSHAHMKGLIHRDLKPSNIMVVESETSGEIVKLIDFGIAKLTETSLRTNHNLTETGEVFGTPTYMSPEQCLGFEVDERSDIYSLGCVMYESLTGKPLFAGSNAIQIISKHLSQAPTDMDQIDERLAEIIKACLAKEAGDRPKSAREILLGLQKIKFEDTGLSVSFHLSAFKQWIRSRSQEVLPSSRLAYGAFGVLMWPSLLISFMGYNWAFSNQNFAVCLALCVSQVIFSFAFLFSHAARARLREVTRLVGDTQPFIAEIVSVEKRRLGFAAVKFLSGKREIYCKEDIRTFGNKSNSQCFVWADKSGNRIAADIEGTTALRFDPIAIMKKCNLWMLPVFLWMSVCEFYHLSGGQETGVLPLRGMFFGFYVLICGYSVFKTRRQGDRFLVPLFITSLFSAVWILVAVIALGVGVEHLPAGTTASRLESFRGWGSASGSLVTLLWMLYGSVRFLEGKGVIQIRNKRVRKQLTKS